jgi:hypothetical protein
MCQFRNYSQLEKKGISLANSVLTNIPEQIEQYVYLQGMFL